MVIKQQIERGKWPGKMRRQNLFSLLLHLLLPTDKVKFLWPFEAGIICHNSYCVDVMVDMFLRTSQGRS